MLDLTPINAPLNKIRQIETELNLTLIERDEVVRTLLLALLTRQHAVLLGPPGTAKSLAITELAKRIGNNGANNSNRISLTPGSSETSLEMIGESETLMSRSSSNIAGGSGSSSLKTFIWLVTKTTQPDELFGPVSITGLKHDEFRRVTTNKLPQAEFVFLDEVFKGGSAILNALLTIMNERQFDNGTVRESVPLISLVAASNEMPQGEDLQAMWDRLVLRVMVEYVSDGGFARMMQAAAQPAQITTVSRMELLTLQQAVAQIPIPASVYDAIGTLRKDLTAKGITVSDRRWRWSLDLLRAQALMEGRGIVEEDDLMILRDALWSAPEQRGDIGRMAARLANPINARAVEFGDQATVVYQNMKDALASATTEVAKTNAVMEAQPKLKELKTKVLQLREQAERQGRSTARVQGVAAQLEKYGREVLEHLSV